MRTIKVAGDCSHRSNALRGIVLNSKCGVMSSAILPDVKELIGAIHYRPAISIIMPFEPKMNLKTELVHRLKLAMDKVEREVRQSYHDDLATMVLQKLRAIIENLNFNTYKKSIAIYVSPLFEKVLYLDIPVQEKIIIDESFEIRDLVYAKKELHKYLVLLLSGKWAKVYLGNSATFIRVKTNVPDNIADFANDVPERVSNFSDPSSRKEILIKKFLHHTDEGLRFLLKAYPLPVFVSGAKKIVGYFKSLTKNQNSIVGYVHGNYEDATESELHKIIGSHVEDWKKIKIKDLQHQLESAAGAGKLAIGIKDVWRYASQHRGRLLIVEKNFMFAAQFGDSSEIINELSKPYSEFSYIKDAVDDIIEKVLEDGGDVEFVDEELLKNYQRIALIQYY